MKNTMIATQPENGFEHLQIPSENTEATQKRGYSKNRQPLAA